MRHGLAEIGLSGTVELEGPGTIGIAALLISEVLGTAEQEGLGTIENAGPLESEVFGAAELVDLVDAEDTVAAV